MLSLFFCPDFISIDNIEGGDGELCDEVIDCHSSAVDDPLNRFKYNQSLLFFSNIHF